MKKKSLIIVVGICLLVSISTASVFLPAIFHTGLIGTYIPVEIDGDALYSSLKLKANNKAIIVYAANNSKETIPWYAKCDGERTAIYLKFSETRERQFNLVGPRELKDINHYDIYKKK